MTALDATAIDPADPNFLADPYPVFDALREQGAVHWHPGWGKPVVVSHAGCSQVLRSRGFGRVWSDVQPAGEFTAFNVLHRPNMLENEDHHDRYRAVFAPLFHRRHLQTLRDAVAEVAERRIRALVEQIRSDGQAEFMSVVAHELPVEIICTMLDFPKTDAGVMRGWSNRIVAMYEPTATSAAQRDAETAASEFRDYVGELVEHRRRHPGRDILSQLATSHGPAALDRDEVIANYILLLMAGHEATVNGLGNAVAALSRFPAQWAYLRDHAVGDEAAMGTAVDELLRYDTPNQMFERTAHEPLDLAGYPIDKGETVVALLGAANRDPAAFTGPGQLNLRRTPNPHLALGAGVHYCLGAPLARLEITTALAALARHLPGHHAYSGGHHDNNLALRGHATLTITQAGSILKQV